jgi:hypothetical protein
MFADDIGGKIIFDDKFFSRGSLFCGVFGWCGIFEIRFKLRTGGNIF